MAHNPNLDTIQTLLSPPLVDCGYLLSGRTFVRELRDGLAHVVDLQAGQRSLQGKFTINLGVFVPEAYRLFAGSPPARIHAYDCEIRARLGRLMPEHRDSWWPTLHHRRPR